MAKRKYDAEHRAWAKRVKEKYGNVCVVCGSPHKMLNAHHLIPWEFEEYRHDINNGIALCPKHHTKYGFGISPHSHGSALFFIFLMRKKPEVINWLEVNFK